MTQQVRAARTRQALIRSAAIVFEQQGYEQARLASISGGAGVSSGALHFHFANKVAVAEAVVAEASHCLLYVSSTIRLRSDTALQALVDTSHALVDLLGRDPVMRAGFRLSCDGERAGEPGLRTQWQVCVRELLDEADAAGTLAEGVCGRDVTAATVAATTGFEVLGRSDSQWLSAQTLTGFWDLLLPRLAVTEILVLLDLSGTGAAATGAGRTGWRPSPSWPGGAGPGPTPTPAPRDR